MQSDVRDYINSKKNKNTAKKTNQVIKKFINLLSSDSNNLSKSKPEDMPLQELGICISNDN